MDIPSTGHEPVLLNEILGLLAPSPGGVFIDCTLGRAGHASAISARLGSDGLLIGLDADPRNLEFARQRLEQAPCRVRLFHANFAEIEDVLAEVKLDHVDGILADLGISTNQLFESDYGLCFSSDMPLDMRLDPRIDETAADFVNKMREEDLANVLYELAQERYSRRIAKRLRMRDASRRSHSTERLGELVRSAIPTRGGAPERIDPATRTFMALRMKVNRELENLEALLTQAPKFLKAGGRLAVISFHSMEDRLVKQAFRSAEQTGLLKILTKKPLTPSETELAANPRSRSANSASQKNSSGQWRGASGQKDSFSLATEQLTTGNGVAMTRETKIGLLVGLAFIIVIGILLSDHLTRSTEPPQATLAGRGQQRSLGGLPPGSQQSAHHEQRHARRRLAAPNRADTQISPRKAQPVQPVQVAVGGPSNRKPADRQRTATAQTFVTNDDQSTDHDKHHRDPTPPVKQSPSRHRRPDRRQQAQ